MMFSTADGSYMWGVNQITDPSLSISSETADAVDALGSTIATFNRGKSAEFSASNSLFDLGLLAAQNGVDKQEASASKKIVAPRFEELTYDGKTNSVVLSKVPTEDISTIYILNGDGTLGQAYVSGAGASATKFAYDNSTHAITFPTGLAAGTRFMVIYDYEMEAGVAVVGDAVNFPKAGRFILEVLGTDTCDPTTQIHAYLELPNAKLTSDFEISFTTDGNHPFTLQASQNYCDHEKTLYRIIIPNEE